MNCKTALTKSARLAATAGLGLALTFNSVAAPVAAFATAGNLTIENAKKTTYNVYQLMTGDVNSIGTESASFTAPKVNTENKEIITEAVNEFLAEGNKLDKESTNYDSDLQDKLGEISKSKKSQDFATKLAKKFIENNVTATATGVQPDENGKLTVGVDDQGYYLVVSTGAADHSAATRAMLVAIGADTNAELKIFAPELTKRASVDGKQNWVKDVAELGVLDGAATSISYQLTGTLPKNYADFGSYKYEFTDVLPTGLDVASTKELTKDWDVSIKAVKGADKPDITDKFTASVTTADATHTSTITWTCEDLKKVEGLDSDYSIVVEYTPKMDTITADKGTDVDRLFNAKTTLKDTASEGFKTLPRNTATLTYSASPYAEDTQTTVAHTVEARSYNLVLDHVDGSAKTQPSSVDQTVATLKGSEFKLYKKDGDTKTLAGHVIAKSGTADDGSDSDGSFTVTGLTSGDYVLEETKTAKGKKHVENIKFTIKYEGNKLTCTETSDPSNASKDENDAISVTDATINLTVTSVDGINLPLTGQAGIIAGVVAGGLLITVSVAAIARNRREDQAE